MASGGTAGGPGLPTVWAGEDGVHGVLGEEIEIKPLPAGVGEGAGPGYVGRKWFEEHTHQSSLPSCLARRGRCGSPGVWRQENEAGNV